MTSVNQGSGTRSATFMANITSATGAVMNMSHVNKFIVWIQTVQLVKNGGNFNLNITKIFINSNNYTLTVTVTGNTKLNNFLFSRLIYD